MSGEQELVFIKDGMEPGQPRLQGFKEFIRAEFARHFETLGGLTMKQAAKFVGRPLVCQAAPVRKECEIARLLKVNRTRCELLYITWRHARERYAVRPYMLVPLAVNDEEGIERQCQARLAQAVRDLEAAADRHSAKTFLDCLRPTMT